MLVREILFEQKIECSQDDVLENKEIFFSTNNNNCTKLLFENKNEVISFFFVKFLVHVRYMSSKN